MRAKYIYEKFEEESDPIHDMGIGMLSQIEDYLNQEKKPSNIVHNRTNANIALDLFKDNAKYEYFKFLIENPDLFNIKPVDLITSLQIAAIHQNWKFAKLLVKNGVDIEEAIKDAKNRDFSTTATRLEMLRDSIDSISVNEKFTEEGDPIKDMGIGIYAHHDFSTVKKLLQWIWDALPTIFGGSIPEDIIYNTVDSGFYRDMDIWSKINKYVSKYLTLNGEKYIIDWDGNNAIHNALMRKGYQIFPEMKKFWKDSTYNDKPQFKINESLNEKFSDESDPIHDMGIGMKEQINIWLKEMEDIFPSYDNGKKRNYKFYPDALTYSAAFGKIEFVKYLLSKYNLEYFKNDTESWENALPWAAEKGHYKIVKMLLDYGFDPSVLDNYALRYAEMKKYRNIIKLLKKDPRVIAEEEIQEKIR